MYLAKEMGKLESNCNILHKRNRLAYLKITSLSQQHYVTDAIYLEGKFLYTCKNWKAISVLYSG